MARGMIDTCGLCAHSCRLRSHVACCISTWQAHAHSVYVRVHACTRACARAVVLACTWVLQVRYDPCWRGRGALARDHAAVVQHPLAHGPRSDTDDGLPPRAFSDGAARQSPDRCPETFRPGKFRRGNFRMQKRLMFACADARDRMLVQPHQPGRLAAGPGGGYELSDLWGQKLQVACTSALALAHLVACICAGA